MQNQASLQETKQHGAVRFPFNLYPCTIPGGTFRRWRSTGRESMELVFVKRGTGLVQVGAESCPARMGDILFLRPAPSMPCAGRRAVHGIRKYHF